MTTPAVSSRCVLTLSCPDAPGIVHAVSGFLLEQRCTIVQSQQFDAPDTRRFFLRVEFAGVDGGGLDVAALRDRFTEVSARWDMAWRMVDAERRQRVIVLASRYAHCLNDLLFRNSVGDLALDVVAVVSDQPDLGRLADHYGVPFRHVPVTPESRAEAEAHLLAIVDDHQVDLVVLARYLPALSPGLCTRLEGRAINLHHSALPSFSGPQPYRQAYTRGVKVIGATAHYVTADLGEGPIIEQETIRVDHAMTVEDFAKAGREVECRTLARAVRWHTENRVVLNDCRTVVLQ